MDKTVKISPLARKESISSDSSKKLRRRRPKAVAFGRNYYYALGNSEQVRLPTEKGSVDAFVWEHCPWKKKGKSKGDDDQEVVGAACTTQSSMFLTRDGKVYQTGTIHGRILQSPTQVKIQLPLKCVQISAGRHFCIGRMEGGLAVVTWGAGHFGQLGIGSPSGVEESDHQVITFASQPVVVERLLPNVIGSSVVSVAAGDWHSLALTESGKLWAWGSNRNLQCGRKPPKGGTTNAAPTVTLPMPISMEHPVAQIAAGRSHSIALTRSDAKVPGQVYCWGSSNHGQCGNSVRRSTGVAPPRRVEGLAKLSVAHITAGGNHSLALTSGGRVFAWGAGSEGQLGLGPAVQTQCQPRMIADLDFVAIAAGQGWKAEHLDSSDHSQGHHLAHVPKISQIYAGSNYSAAVSSAGHVYMWGSNDAAQIGLSKESSTPTVENTNASELRDLHVKTFDSRHNVLLPVRIDAVSDMHVNLVACGPNHLWCFGKDRNDDEDVVIGRTMHEVQKEHRAQRYESLRDPKTKDLPISDELLGHYESTMSPANYMKASLRKAERPGSRKILNGGNELEELTPRDVSSTPMSQRGVVSIPADKKEEFKTASASLPAQSPIQSPGTPGTPKRRGLMRRFSLKKVLRRMSSGKDFDRNNALDGSEGSRRSKGSGRSSRK